MITRLTSLNLRGFSTSAASLANRAIIFSKLGSPPDVLQAQTYPSLPPPPPRSINVRYKLSPINPADINVIQGVYPAKPARVHDLAGFKFASNDGVFVGGNEGLAVVTEVGEAVEGLKKGDRVVMNKPQSGTWRSASVLGVTDVTKVPDEASDGFAATMTVNFATAYNMLNDFVDLKEGDWVIQNGANSAVGQAVIQIAASRGLKTLNFVRNRDNIDSLKTHLTNLGATKVLTYDALNDPTAFKSLRTEIQQLTNGRPIRLFLNCVSGPTTTSLSRLLGKNAHLVSYGAMSKEPLSLPTSLFIFKNLTCHGFWQSRWYEDASEEKKRGLVEKLVGLKLKEAEHEVLTIPAGDSDEVATGKIRDIMRKLEKGQYGKKVLLNIEEPED